MGKKRKFKPFKDKPIFFDFHKISHKPLMEQIKEFIDEFNSGYFFDMEYYDKIGEFEELDPYCVISHGYGSSGVGGVTRKEVRKILEQNEVEFLCGEDLAGFGRNIDRNRGVTLVKPNKFIFRDPNIRKLELSFVEKLILDFCDKPTNETELVEWLFSGPCHIYDEYKDEILYKMVEKELLVNYVSEGESIYIRS